MVISMPMEKKDVQSAASGSDEKSLRELISAQIAILDSAIKLINQDQKNIDKNAMNAQEGPGWVYNMKDLADWVKYYTDRRRLHCPNCKADTTFRCETCDEVYEFHDEL